MHAVARLPNGTTGLVLDNVDLLLAAPGSLAAGQPEARDESFEAATGLQGGSSGALPSASSEGGPEQGPGQGPGGAARAADRPRQALRLLREVLAAVPGLQLLMVSGPAFGEADGLPLPLGMEVSVLPLTPLQPAPGLQVLLGSGGAPALAAASELAPLAEVR